MKIIDDKITELYRDYEDLSAFFITIRKNKVSCFINSDISNVVTLKYGLPTQFGGRITMDRSLNIQRHIQSIKWDIISFYGVNAKVASERNNSELGYYIVGCG